MRKGAERSGAWPGRLLPFLLAALPLLFAPAAQAAPAFADWQAVVVAGDWHDHDGGPSEGFDNARRDVAAALQRAGFQAGNIHQFSVRPERYTPHPAKSDLGPIYDGLIAAADRVPAGCLVYFSSHGGPDGLVLNAGKLSPGVLASMLDSTCGERPTIVIVSACFSGVFIPPLARPNRMILTAARRDRASFGCGQDDHYPYFDDCFLQSIPAAHEFLGLAEATRACVAQREKAIGAKPPSEPQLWIGAGLRPMLQLYSFEAAPPPRL